MSERAKYTFQWLTISVALALAGLLFHSGMKVQAIESKNQEQDSALADIKGTIKSIPVIETDIKWIRQEMEKQNKEQNK